MTDAGCNDVPMVPGPSSCVWVEEGGFKWCDTHHRFWPCLPGIDEGWQHPKPFKPDLLSAILRICSGESQVDDGEDAEDALKWIEKLIRESGEVAKHAPLSQADAGFDEATETRWQVAIYEACKKAVGPDADYLIDGGGCDSGDALDFTLVEINQAFEFLREVGEAKHAPRIAEKGPSCTVCGKPMKPVYLCVCGSNTGCTAPMAEEVK